MSDLIYSATLLAALIASGIAAAAAGWLLAVRPSGARARRPCRVARAAAVVALASGSLSAAVHLVSGHRPGTPGALGPVRFVSIHPSFVVVLVVAAVALLAARGVCTAPRRLPRDP